MVWSTQKNAQIFSVIIGNTILLMNIINRIYKWVLAEKNKASLVA